MRQQVSRMDGSISDIRSFQAEQTSEFESIRQELRGLVGRIEALEFAERARAATNNSGAPIPTNSLQMAQMNQQPPAIVPLDLLETDLRYSETLPRRDVAELFRNALMNIRAGKFSEAMGQLQEAYDKNYTGEGSPQILFWRSVCYEGIGDHRGALESYGSLITSPQANTRKAAALLRQGSVFIRMGDFNTAELALKKLIADYPRSPEAAQAKQKLNDLRQPGRRNY